MANIFTQVLMPKVSTNVFDLSHDHKTSFSMGELIPTACIECIPGDNFFEMSCENMLRFAPLISPVMHKIRVTTHYFFVPNRILWPEWEKWITNDSDVAAPFLQILEDDFPQVGGLADYLGYPTGTVGPAANLKVSPFPIAAYAKIWNEYYRDQNLQDELNTTLVPADNGSNLLSWFNWSNNPLRRAWQHDYLTSALPFAQKGDNVQLPLVSEDNIPVDFTAASGQAPSWRNPANGTPINGGPTNIQAGVGGGLSLAGGAAAGYDPDGSLTVDVQAGATTINTLRTAFRLQEWLEKNARGGSRYIENIMAHFGVKSSDARLQRPEYIGGSKQNMIISEVLATAETTAANITVGEMAGHGISVGGGNRFRYRAEEHGYIIGIINVQPDTAYQQGLARHLSRFDRLQYAWPTFAHLGEQEILNKELLGFGTNPDGIFGYIPRFAEYKHHNSRVSGQMKTSLDYWHLSRQFSGTTPPALNAAFIECNPDPRIFAVTDPAEDHIYAHIFNNIKVKRKLPRFGIPSF